MSELHQRDLSLILCSLGKIEEMPTEKSFRERLLEQGLPAKLDEVSDCPIESSDFQEFRKGVLECLKLVEKHLDSGEASKRCEEHRRTASVLRTNPGPIP